MGDSVTSGVRDDLVIAQQPSVLGVVVASVSEQLALLAPGPATETYNLWNAVCQKQQLGGVVAIPFG